MSLSKLSAISQLPNKADRIIFPKLEKENILLVNDLVFDPAQPAAVFSTQLSRYHYCTILSFFTNFYSILLTLIPSEVSNDYDTEHYMLLLTLGGWFDAMNKSIARETDAIYDVPRHFRIIKKLFSDADIEIIRKVTETVMVDISEQIKACRIDLERDRSQQIKTIKETVEVIQEAHAKKDLSIFDKLWGTKNMDTLMAIYLDQRRSDIVGTPSERLLLSLTKLFVYWEILVSSGHVLLSKDPLKPQWKVFPTLVWELRS